MPRFDSKIGLVAALLISVILLTFGLLLVAGVLFFWLMGSKADLERRFAQRQFLETIDFYTADFHLRAGEPFDLEKVRQKLLTMGRTEVNWSEPLRPGSFKLLSAEKCRALLQPHSLNEVKLQGCLVVVVSGSPFSSEGVYLLAGRANGTLAGIYTGEAFLQEVGGLSFNPRLSGQLLGRTPIFQKWEALGGIPPPCLDGVLAIEDAQFLEHRGLSGVGFARAFLSNLRNLRVTQGGSTITQQLVKNYFLSHDRTIERKVKEALIALLIENFASKDDILETYLNIIYMGQAGAFEVRGFGAASHYYFNRPLEQLDLPECAFLAAVINSPGKFHPIRYPERARARRDLVLRKLQELGKISERQRQAASAAALPVKLSFDSPETLPFVFDAVLAERLQESERSRDKAKKNSKAFGEKILMTIDRRKQELAQASVNQGLAELRALRDQISTKFERSAKSIKKEDKVSRGQEKPDSLQAALISVEVSSGRVVALVGGTDWRLAPFNRALRANRQIGSLVKPWIAYLGFLLDQELTANSIWRDEPVQVPVPGGQWEPKNYDGNVRGPVRFREAFSQSLNLPFVHYGLSLGLPKVRRALSEVMGVEVPSLPSVLLGSFEATPMILTEAFYRLVASVEQPVNIDLARDLGSQGARTAGPLKIFPLRHIEASIQGEQLSQGTSRFTLEPAYTSALDDRASALTLELMEETCLSGTGRAVQKVFVGERVACKTGTTSDLRDSWFVGYARGYLTLVWVGTDTPQNTGLTGASGALPIWLRYQKSL